MGEDQFRDIAIRREAIALMPWGHEMLRAYLREVETTNLDTREQRKEMLRLTGGVPSTLCLLVNRSRYPGRISPQDLAKEVPGSDFSQILLSSEVREALATLEETDTIEDYETMMELLCAGTTFRGSEDIVPDLKMLGIVQAHVRWPRLFGQPGGSAKVYSGCFSGRQNPLESILLLLRLWRCGQGAERLVHHIHRRVASVCLGRRPPAQRRVRPLGVVEADPLADHAPGGEAVGDLVQVDRLVFERAPQPLDD